MATFGPIYAWYVIAKTVIKYTHEPENTKQSKRLVYKKSEENLINKTNKKDWKFWKK